MKKAVGAPNFWRSITPRSIVNARILFVPVLLIVASACSFAPMTEEEIYKRAVARNEAEDEYLLKKMACDNIGGIMVFDYYSSKARRNRKLTVVQMKSSRCERTLEDMVRDMY